MGKAGRSMGLWVGGLAAVLLLALLYLGGSLFGLPFVPFDFWIWQALVIPWNVLSLAVSGIGTALAQLVGASESVWGKSAAQIGAIAINLGIAALVGLAIERAKRRTSRKGLLVGTAAGMVLFVLVAAMELKIGVDSPVTALVWLAIAFVGWGTIVGALLDGWIFESLLAEADVERRSGLIRLAGAMVGAAVAAWGIEKLLGSGRAAPAVEPGGTDALLPDQPLPNLAPTPTLPLQVEATRTPPPAGAVEIPVGDDGRIVPAPGTRAEVTPDGQFYAVDIAATPPDIDGTLWRLIIAGLFDQTPRLTMADLRSYPAHTQPITLSCISNTVGGSAIGTAYWTGLRLSDLLDDLGLNPEANYLYIQAADGFYETVPMEDMMMPETLLVYGMNGRSLPKKHGYPLRIYLPDRFGMKQPKWIERMEAVEEDKGGYWRDRGWSKEARAQTTSVVDTVATDEARDGYVPLGGIAWAGARGIQKVEVQVDEGTWTEASMRTPPLGPLTWVQWRHEWPVTPGEHTFRARATDGTGEPQTAPKSGALPDGSTGYHSVKETT